MSINSNTSAQEAFLKEMQSTKALVSIFLLNGVRLQGVIIEFDSSCIILSRKDMKDVKDQDRNQLVLKSAVSTITPQSDNV